MIKVHYDNETKKVLGFYPEDVVYTNIPEPTIKITKEQWRQALDLQENQTLYIENGEIVGRESTPTESDIANSELGDLTKWFEWYDRQVQEYARCTRLGIEYTNTLGLTLTELDNLAEEKKARINELRQIIGG